MKYGKEAVMRLDKQLEKYYYTAAQARKVLGLNEQSFQYWIRKERINKVILPGRTQGLYSRKEVDELATQIISAILPEQTETIVFRKANIEDIEQEAQLAHLIFGKKAEAIEDRKRFLDANPDVDYHLYDRDKLVAYINVVPLKHHAIEDFIKGGIIAWQIKTDDIEQYEPGKPVECLIIDMVTTPTVPPAQRSSYASRLLAGIVRVLSHAGENGIEITKVYAASETPSGIRILKHAGFQVIEEAREGRFSFEIDIQNSEEKVLKEYKEAIARYKEKQSSIAKPRTRNRKKEPVTQVTG